MNNISILDCTLRDGSYVVNYQFSAEDCFIISNALSTCGVNLIEVGHGQGLDAQHKGLGAARETDATYVKSAVEAVSKKSQIGVFFIPGIGELDSISKMVDVGLNFIRIGTNATNYEAVEQAIIHANKHGLAVSCNLMKSYDLSPATFATYSKHIEEMGADTVCVVDSAGGMMPRQVSEFVAAAKDKISIEIGFHGHNNLRLAEANCLAAIEAGATIIDATLRGMGRSAGNPSTEILAGLLDREGYKLGNIDFRKLMILAEHVIAPMLPKDHGLKIDEIATGLTFFHSGFQPLISDASEIENVPCFDTILSLDKGSGSNVTREVAAEAAKRASATKRNTSPNARKFSKGMDWKAQQPQTTEDLLNAIEETASKSDTVPVITIARSTSKLNRDVYITPIRLGGGYCIGHIESRNEASDRQIFGQLERKYMPIIVDRPISVPAEINRHSDVFVYDDILLTLQAIETFLRAKMSINNYYFPAGEGDTAALIESRLNFISKTVGNFADIGIAIFQDNPFTIDDVNRIKNGGIILLASNFAIEENALISAREKDIELCRLDLSECLIAMVANLIETHQRICKKAGRLKINDFWFVSGGILGEKGDIVINDINNPRMVYGVANGFGAIEPLSNLGTQQKQVLNCVLEKMLFSELI